MNSTKQMVQAIKLKSNTIESLLKVTKESRPRPNFLASETFVVKGLNQPLHSIALDEVLKNMDIDYRSFYQALRQ
ncbi:hypothetical protein [Acinetobacter colistiniresistens]|nr:hypothetical protein [Acinetobacter colistiniresistens]